MLALGLGLLGLLGVQLAGFLGFLCLLLRLLLLGYLLLLLGLCLAGRLLGFLTLGLGNAQSLLLLRQLTLDLFGVFLVLLFLLLRSLGLRLLLLLDLLRLLLQELAVQHHRIDDLALRLGSLRLAEVDTNQQDDADDQMQQHRRDEITGNTTLHIHLRQFTGSVIRPT
ncbi:hypothetical protein D3C84_171980 [compost metagenome]